MDWETLTRLEREGKLSEDAASPLDVKRAVRELLHPPKSGAKILYLDIECTPNIADVWGLRDQNIGLSQLKQASRIMGFAYRWNRDTPARWIGEDKYPRFLIALAAHWLYDHCDIVVTYNGNNYDNKVLNAEWVNLGLTPPAPYKSIDLYRVVAKHFRFPSKKLAYVSQELLGDTKVQHSGHDLWNACLDPGVSERERRAAWKLMRKYCRQDVDLLVPLHDRLKPWLPDTANIAIIEGNRNGCPKCGSSNLVKRGFHDTATRRYQRYRCGSCGGWTRSTSWVDSFPRRST